MVAVSGNLIGPGNDAADGTVSLLNPLDSLRADLYDAYIGRMGVVRGMAMSGVAGQMQVSVAAGSAVLSERDSSGVAFPRAYRLDALTAAVVQFNAASASARNDALIACAVDTEDGPRGTGALAHGWHLVSVPGVSGTTTPRTDAQIAAYVGRGGWERLADVPIASTDTQINMANLASTAASVPFNDSGAITNAFTVAAGWTLNSQMLRRVGRFVYFSVIATRTGADLVSVSGNISNTAVVTWSTARYPILFDAPAGTAGIGFGVFGLAQTGTLYVTAVANESGDLLTTNQIELAGHWVSV
jgi:hypothetical protein